jgi:hypothetical protein
MYIQEDVHIHLNVGDDGKVSVGGSSVSDGENSKKEPDVDLEEIYSTCNNNVNEFVETAMNSLVPVEDVIKFLVEHNVMNYTDAKSKADSYYNKKRVEARRLRKESGTEFTKDTDTIIANAEEYTANIDVVKDFLKAQPLSKIQYYSKQKPEIVIKDAMDWDENKELHKESKNKEITMKNRFIKKESYTKNVWEQLKNLHWLPEDFKEDGKINTDSLQKVLEDEFDYNSDEAFDLSYDMAQNYDFEEPVSVTEKMEEDFEDMESYYYQVTDSDGGEGVIQIENDPDTGQWEVENISYNGTIEVNEVHSSEFILDDVLQEVSNKGFVSVSEIEKTSLHSAEDGEEMEDDLEGEMEEDPETDYDEDDETDSDLDVEEDLDNEEAIEEGFSKMNAPVSGGSFKASKPEKGQTMPKDSIQLNSPQGMGGFKVLGSEAPFKKMKTIGTGESKPSGKFESKRVKEDMGLGSARGIHTNKPQSSGKFGKENPDKPKRPIPSDKSIEMEPESGGKFGKENSDKPKMKVDPTKTQMFKPAGKFESKKDIEDRIKFLNEQIFKLKHKLKVTSK